MEEAWRSPADAGLFRFGGAEEGATRQEYAAVGGCRR
ncbi:hypothetical protein P38_1105 [Pseudomonas aeruginosa MH38]|nr:hypothetical protein P38_1105 [Pseudomonas aeruginosa MH38]